MLCRSLLRLTLNHTTGTGFDLTNPFLTPPFLCLSLTSPQLAIMTVLSKLADSNKSVLVVQQMKPSWYINAGRKTVQTKAGIHWDDKDYIECIHIIHLAEEQLALYKELKFGPHYTIGLLELDAFLDDCRNMKLIFQEYFSNESHFELDSFVCVINKGTTAYRKCVEPFANEIDMVALAGRVRRNGALRNGVHISSYGVASEDQQRDTSNGIHVARPRIHGVTGQRADNMVAISNMCRALQQKYPDRFPAFLDEMENLKEHEGRLEDFAHAINKDNVWEAAQEGVGTLMDGKESDGTISIHVDWENSRAHGFTWHVAVFDDDCDWVFVD